MCLFNDIKITDWINAVGTLGAAGVALTTFCLYRKSERERRPKISGEIVISGYYADGLTIFSDTEIKLWNEGLVGSCVKQIELRPLQTFHGYSINMKRGYEDSMRLEPGQIVTKTIKIILGCATPETAIDLYGEVAKNTVERAFVQGTALKVGDFEFIVHFTNHRPIQIFQIKGKGGA